MPLTFGFDGLNVGGLLARSPESLAIWAATTLGATVAPLASVNVTEEPNPCARQPARNAPTASPASGVFGLLLHPATMPSATTTAVTAAASRVRCAIGRTLPIPRVRPKGSC